MTMEYGCLKEGEDAFCKRWDIKPTQDGKTTHFRGAWFNNAPAITEVFGDCTAATLYFSFVDVKTLAKQLLMMQEYMSLNGRISALFTLHVSSDEESTNAVLAVLKSFAIQGLHLQYSNRNSGKGAYQITGILTVPNPAVRYNYHHWTYDPHAEHDISIDGRDNVAINKKHGLKFNLGK